MHYHYYNLQFSSAFCGLQLPNGQVRKWCTIAANGSRNFDLFINFSVSTMYSLRVMGMIGTNVAMSTAGGKSISHVPGRVNFTFAKLTFDTSWIINQWPTMGTKLAQDSGTVVRNTNWISLLTRDLSLLQAAADWINRENCYALYRGIIKIRNIDVGLKK